MELPPSLLDELLIVVLLLKFVLDVSTVGVGVVVFWAVVAVAAGVALAIFEVRVLVSVWTLE